MGRIMAAARMPKGGTVPGVGAGKPLLVGGSAGRREATGRGLVYIIDQAAREAQLDLKDASVAIQGYGNVGSVVAHLLWRQGSRIIAVADAKGGGLNPRGLDIGAPSDHARE